MINTTTILQLEAGTPLLASQLKALLANVHDDSPIMIGIGEEYVHVKEWRQRSTSGGLVTKVLVPVDYIPVTM